MEVEIWQIYDCKIQKKLKMYSNCGYIPVLYEFGVTESNGVVRIAAGSSEMDVSEHAQ